MRAVVGSNPAISAAPHGEELTVILDKAFRGALPSSRGRVWDDVKRRMRPGRALDRCAGWSPARSSRSAWHEKNFIRALRRHPKELRPKAQGRV